MVRLTPAVRAMPRMRAQMEMSRTVILAYLVLDLGVVDTKKDFAMRSVCQAYSYGRLADECRRYEGAFRVSSVARFVSPAECSTLLHSWSPVPRQPPRMSTPKLHSA
jgi:hypothetical protein